METSPDSDECFLYAKEYDETFLGLIYDVLSAHPIEIEVEASNPVRYTTHLIYESAARNEALSCGALKLFSSDTGVLLLARSNIALGASQALIKALRVSGNKIYLQPQVMKSAVTLLGRLSRKEELQRDLNIIDDVIRVVDNLVSLGLEPAVYKAGDTGWIALIPEELDNIIGHALQALNEHFKDETGRRMNRANAPTMARKISETQIVKKLKLIIEKQPDQLKCAHTVQQTLILISHLANEVPTLIGRILDS